MRPGAAYQQSRVAVDDGSAAILAPVGDPEHLGRVLAVMQKRARRLGLYPPRRVMATVRDELPEVRHIIDCPPHGDYTAYLKAIEALLESPRKHSRPGVGTHRVSGQWLAGLAVEGRGLAGGSVAAAPPADRKGAIDVGGRQGSWTDCRGKTGARACKTGACADGNHDNYAAHNRLATIGWLVSTDGGSQRSVSIESESLSPAELERSARGCSRWRRRAKAADCGRRRRRSQLYRSTREGPSCSLECCRCRFGLPSRG